MGIDLTDEQLKQLEEYAAALLPPGDIAILLNVCSGQRKLFTQMCKSHVNTPVYDAYQRGKLTTKFKLRSTVVKLAVAGSPAAEPLAVKFISEQEKEE